MGPARCVRSRDWSSKRRMRQRYDASADAYDAAYELEQSAKHEAALKFASPGNGEVALDIGCGPGRLLEILAAQVGLAVGVDLSARVLGLAAQRVHARPNVALVCCDGEYLPFMPGVFQTVFAITVLQNLPSPQRCLGEALRVMSPGGRLVASFLRKSFRAREAQELLAAVGLRLQTLDDNPDLKDVLALCRPPVGE